MYSRAVFKGKAFGINPENSHLKNFQHFQHISAVAVVNIATILSRSIAFSFHLKRCDT